MNATVTQLVSPTGWNGVGASSQIFDAYFDKDGTTAWVFQFLNPGFARIDLATNTLLFSGTIFGDTSSNKTEFLTYAGDNTLFWFQDGDGHYITMYAGSHGAHPFFDTFYKLQIGASTSGDMGNGYMETVDTALVNGLFGTGPTPSTGLKRGCNVAFKTGGVNYVAFNCSRWLVVINTDTWTQVGRFDTGSSSYANAGCFLDQNGDLWAAWHRTTSTGDFKFFKWTPASGATGGVLNGTSTVVLQATTGLPNANNVISCNVPSQNAIALFALATSQAALLDLSTFSLLASKATDTTFIYNDWQSGMDMAMDKGVQPDGTLGIQGSVNPIVTQRGGILNVIDPETFALIETCNITDAVVNTPGVTLPPTDTGGVYGPWAAATYDRPNNRMLVTFQRGAFTITASAAFLVEFTTTSTVFGNYFVMS